MKLIYCATPSRLADKTSAIMDYVTAQGFGPFHPFQAFDIARFENGPVGRELTLAFCCRAIEICDEFWLFGISEGTLRELEFANSHTRNGMRKPIHFLLDFDPDWYLEWEGLRKHFENLEALVLERSDHIFHRNKAGG